MMRRFLASSTYKAFLFLLFSTYLFGCANESKLYMAGVLGEFPSSIALTRIGNQFEGAFDYNDSNVSGRTVELNGNLVANILTLQEVNEGGHVVPGVFIGRFDGQSYKGNWEDAAGKSSVPFEFELVMPHEETNSIAEGIGGRVKKPTVPLITYEMYGEGLFPNSNSRIRAKLDGQVFEDLTDTDVYAISEEYFEPAYRLIQVLDLNGDGYNEAIIEDGSGSGASRCALEFFICNYNPSKKKFELSNSFGSACPTLEIVTKDGKKLIKLVVNEQGFDRVEMIQHTKYYKFDGKKSVKLVESIRTEPTPAVKELLAAYFTEENSSEEISMEVDLDKDGRMDIIVADYWFRWGLLNWRVYFNGKAKASLTGSGKRIGVLSTSTHGVHDLVNDLNTIYFWNGEEYVSGEE